MRRLPFVAVMAGAAAIGLAGLTFAQGSNESTAKYCALTFDDGPDVVKTSRILERLEKYHVSATFFYIGRLVSDQTKPVIEKYTGNRPRFFRPPNLAVDGTMSQAIDMPFAGGVLGYDWAGCETTAEQRSKNVLKAVDDGAIILLHDAQPDPHPTPEALDILIPALKKRGYEFVTLSRLFALKGVTPEIHDGRLWVYVK